MHVSSCTIRCRHCKTFFLVNYHRADGQFVAVLKIETTCLQDGHFVRPTVQLFVCIRRRTRHRGKQKQLNTSVTPTRPTPDRL